MDDRPAARVNLRSPNLHRVDLFAAELGNSVWPGGIAQATFLAKSREQGADLSDAILEGMDFSKANTIEGANSTRAKSYQQPKQE